MRKNCHGRIPRAGLRASLTSLLTGTVASTSTVVADSAPTPITIACTNNSTHVGWIQEPSFTANGYSSADATFEGGCFYQTHEEAKAEMMLYLWQNIMAYDVPNAITLGYDVDALASYVFASKNDDDDGNGEHAGLDGGNSFAIRATSRASSQSPPNRPTVDGLSDGILNQTLYYSLLSKSLYPWTDAVPKSIYMEYVVPYAVVNEPRTDYRSLLFDALRDLLSEYERPLAANQSLDADERPKPSRNLYSYAQTQTQIKRVVKAINTRLWSILARRSSQPIRFQAGLTPRIYDPLSVISHGRSSCTGLAILLVAALRTVGIPARMAGTPAWNGVEEEGNHSWLEVFLPTDDDDADDDGDEGGKWMFLEPSPGIAEGGEESADADDLDRDPCKRWFCKASRFDGSTRVFATRYTKTEGMAFEKMSGARGVWLDEDSETLSETFYRMAWAPGEEHVPGVERTDYYNKHCGEC
ncbi:hypothetical protein ACHAXS_012006 [Conticribra weissflogii]